MWLPLCALGLAAIAAAGPALEARLLESRRFHGAAAPAAGLLGVALALSAGAMLGWWGGVRRRARTGEREQLEAERRLGEAEVRARLALEASGAEPVDWDLHSGVVRLGPTTRRLLGLEGEPGLEVGALPGLVHGDDAGPLAAALEELLSGRAPLLEIQVRAVSASGGIAWLELRGRVVERGTGGSPLRFAGTAREVTAQRNLASRLEVADRLVAMGTLAAGVGHEINNPLAYLAANLDFLREQLGRLAGNRAASVAVAEMRQALEEAAEGAARVRQIVLGLRHLGRPLPAGRRRVSPRREVEAAARAARDQVSRRARLVLDLPDLPPVEAAEHELGQVFLNLLLNAAQAIPEGRALENEVRVSGRIDGDGQVVLEFRDSGAGIPRDSQGRIFDPFFTTRPVGQGTGLGLSVSQGIVAGLGGRIEVESTPGSGSVFRVVLPPAAPRPGEGAGDPPLPPPE